MSNGSSSSSLYIRGLVDSHERLRFTSVYICYVGKVENDDTLDFIVVIYHVYAHDKYI